MIALCAKLAFLLLACSVKNKADGRAESSGGLSTDARSTSYVLGGGVAEAAVDEIEPNGTRAEAHALAAGPSGLSIAGDTRISGSIASVGDIDVYEMNLATDSLVRLETFDASGTSCSGISTTLRAYNYVTDYSDSFSGIGSCGALVLRLAAGQHHVEVGETGNDGLISGYVLEAKFATDPGTERETSEGQNDSIALAEPLMGSDVYVSGSVPGGVMFNSDYFAIDVPAGYSVRAEILEPGVVDPGLLGRLNPSPRGCESLRMKPALQLYDCSGTELAFDSGDGRGDCPQIDGTGGPNQKDARAGNLAGGRYYLRVTSTTRVHYSLHVTIRLAGTAGASCQGRSDGAACGVAGHCCRGVCQSNYDPMSCGSSCTPCPRSIATLNNDGVVRATWFATCDGNSCGFECIPRFYNYDDNDAFEDCDGIASNGCEANLSSTASCGRCGCRCSASRAFCDNLGCEPFGCQ